MPKYAEGAVSPSGKFVVQGGKWVSRPTSGPLETRTDEQGRTLSFPDLSWQASEGARPGQVGAVALGLGGSAPGAVLGMAKDAALYGAAEGAEKLLGLPSWVGETVGLVSPGKKLGKLLLGGVFGRAAEKGVATAAAEEAAKRTAAAAEKRAALEAEKVAVRKKSLEIAERRLALAEQRAATATSKATPKVSTTGTVPAEVAPPPVKPVSKPVGPDATIPATPATTVATPRPGVADPRSEFERLVSQLRFIRRTSPEGSKTISEFLKSQPKEVADELRAALAKGYDAPVTNLGGHAKLTMPQSKLGYELAKMLGQVQ